MVAFTLIGEQVALQIDPKTPLLWALREQLKSSGTKFGCGKGLCGACITPVSSINGMAITTIEGLRNQALIRFNRHGLPKTSPSADTASSVRLCLLPHCL